MSRTTPDAFREGVERVNDALGDPRPVTLPAARTFEDARFLELLDGTLGRRQGDAHGDAALCRRGSALQLAVLSPVSGVR